MKRRRRLPPPHPIYGLRTTYTRAQREALFALARSCPTPEHYRRERARIVEEKFP